MTFEIKGQQFDSNLTDDQVAAKCGELTGRFPQDLARAYKRWGWSPKQRAWAHKLATEADTPRPATTDTFSFKGESIIAKFEEAASKLKFPKITYVVDAQCIQFKLVRSGRNVGCVNISNGGRYGTPGNEWYGRIERDGNWTQPRSTVPQAVVDFVIAFAADPANAAAEHGHLSGHCCFCSKQLDDERSTTVGYGPVCAKNWGLPWGAKAETVNPNLMTDEGPVDLDEPVRKAPRVLHPTASSVSGTETVDLEELLDEVSEEEAIEAEVQTLQTESEEQGGIVFHGLAS